MSDSNDIDKEILDFLGMLSQKKKEAVLAIVKTFAEEKVTLWDMMPDEVRLSLEKSLKQSENGEGRSHEEVMKAYDKWLQK
jgi:hypothetical protein